MKNSTHPLQAPLWGEFRKKTGVKVVQENGIQLTIHPIPHTPWTIGYFPKGPMPDEKMIKELFEIGKQNNCIFIQLEPNVQRIRNQESRIMDFMHNSLFIIHNSFHPLFTKYTFILDLTKSEEELLKKMHPKTRYNIKVAQKHNVEIAEDNSDEAFEEYLKLTRETTKRQGFYAHSEQYHRLMWETLRIQNTKYKILNTDKLTAHLLLAKYKNEPLVAWVLFVCDNTLYYPYGASSNKYRETMASNLMMWETIKFGKKMGLKKFDMWGALSDNPDPKDPWYGFHKFKQGYAPQHVEFIGSFDLVINPTLYKIYKVLDRLRWVYLKIIKT